MSAAYLAADAAALGDTELPRAAPIRHLSDTILAELAFAATLFQRAEAAVQDEISRLAGVGITLDGSAALNASISLTQLEYRAKFEILKAKEARR